VITTSPSLLMRLQKGEEAQAWPRFVKLYTPVLYGWVRSQGISCDDAADIVQEVFALLVEKLPTFQYNPEKSFASWLRTVTVNKCRDHYRRGKNRPVLTDPQVDLAIPDNVGQFSVDEYRRRLARRALEIMQSEFQPATWKACWQAVVTNRPAADIAAELGISVNAVYVAKSRVLRRLREELDGIWE
jgi:RNA polymerase sigma-70 factor (ECF subfamily)